MRSTFGNRDDLVIPVIGLGEACEAISLQRFDAVVLGVSVEGQQLANLAQDLRSRNARSGDRTALFRVGSPSRRETIPLDGHLPEGFGPDSLAQALASLSTAVNGPASAGGDAFSDLPVFELEEFEEQVGGDPEFITEIIDLYFSERERQIPEMRDVLAHQQYDALSRLAHTIKGSFGSLHATRARARAQELESAAKQHDSERCRKALIALDSDLAILEPQLVQLRDNLAALSS